MKFITGLVRTTPFRNMLGLLSVLTLILSNVGCGSIQETNQRRNLMRFEFVETQMGMPFRIVLYAPHRRIAEAAAQAAFARLEALNQIFSDYETESELNKLCYQAGEEEPIPLSPDLWRVLEAAQALARQTDGAFDVTIGPYTGLWRKARRENRLPDPARLENARARVGYEKLVLDPARHSARLLVRNMRLDLGGIAKGYALDAALQVLKEHGVAQALVSGGGDIVVGHPPPGRPGWRIELAALDVTNPPPARVVRLSCAAMATSGDLYQRLEIDGRRYSHIVDPRTGLGLTDHSLVNVIAPDGMTADGLATALSVVGPDKGLSLIESSPGTAAYMVRRPQGTIELYESSRFHGFVEKSGEGQP
jgi:thiamine biosynthesis lipoprotein